VAHDQPVFLEQPFNEGTGVNAQILAKNPVGLQSRELGQPARNSTLYIGGSDTPSNNARA
jgi:hypothetical protein